jgi:hypothetical protein
MISREVALLVVLAAACLLPRVSQADMPGPLLANGAFEEGKGEWPEGWARDEWENGRSVFQWEAVGGMGNSRCASIQTSGEANDARWVQKLALEPRTAYLLRGMVKGEGIEVAEKDGTIGANLSQMGIWGCSSDPAKSTGTFDWTPFEVDFATGESGDVEVACRLGHWSSTTRGKAWFDNVHVVRSPAYRRFEGEHVYMLFTDEDLKSISEEHLARWIGHLDGAYEAMADLVGHAPFGGAKIGFYPCSWYCGGGLVAGNPIYWYRGKDYVPRMLAEVDKTDDWSFGHLHEMGHDFDEDGAWNFDGEFWANIKLYYAIETLNGRLGDYVGRDHMRFWKGLYDKLWRDPDPAKRTGEHDGLQYVTLLMEEETGWEPFKETFRWFHALPQNQREMTPWQQFRLFYDKLTEFSGVDAWSYFEPQDLERLRKEYLDK